MIINGNFYSETELRAKFKAMEKELGEIKVENAELKQRISELEDKHWDECRQIAHYSDELRKAKVLLKAAVKVMKGIADAERVEHVDEICCVYCEYDSPLTEYGEMLYECPGCDCDECFKWKHADEAKKLLWEDKK